MRHGRPLTLLLMDVDGLKQINDRFGHAAGDLVLKLFSERLQRAIRGSDLAVRLGGDEFMVLLPECRADEVRHVLARVEGLEVEYERRENLLPLLARLDRLPARRNAPRTAEASGRGALCRQARRQSAEMAEFLPNAVPQSVVVSNA